MIRRTAIALLLSAILLYTVVDAASAALRYGEAPLAPDGRCRGVGPLVTDDPDFCGCTWGRIYYRDQMLFGPTVSLAFSDEQRSDRAAEGEDVDPDPFYSVSGTTMGAKRGDVMTLSTTLAGQDMIRTFRAIPDSAQEQQIDFVLPALGQWQDLLEDGYGAALTLDGDRLWAGGSAGLASVDLTTGISTVHALPWSDPAVRALAVDDSSSLWVAGTGGLLRGKDGAFTTQATPLATAIHALVLDPDSGALWIGGGDAKGGAVAVYDGQWTKVQTTPNRVEALAVDGEGHVWAGTWGAGAFRQPQPGTGASEAWAQFRIHQGLASDYIYDIAANGDLVWFGTQPYLSGSGVKGGVGRYALSSKRWTSFGHADGLPASDKWSGAAADVRAIVVDASGIAWAGTERGLYFMGDERTWIHESPVGVEPIISLTAVEAPIAATAERVAQLRPLALESVTPAVQFDTADGSVFARNQMVVLKGSASAAALAADNEHSSIQAWEWSSTGDGPLCTTAEICRIEASLLQPGEHSMQLRVQNSHGIWSEVDSISITIAEVDRIYLPWISGRP